MRKAYVIAKCLSDENKLEMKKTADECGFDIAFFDTDAEAAGKVSDAEVIYCNSTALFREMPGLRWCHSMSAGVGHFLTSGAFESGDIILTNSSGSYGLVISEYVIMVTLMLMRRIPEYEEVIDRREWIQNLPVRSVAGSSIAIIGTGDIGSNTALRYKALGAERVIGFSRSGRKPAGTGKDSLIPGIEEACFDEVYRIDQFEEVMRREEFDVLVLCVPGTPESEGLLSRERIALLSEKTFVINVGRGTVIDQDTLIDALNEGRIAGAAVDVVYPEPLPKDHPLWTAKNCIVTPHISGDMGLPYTVDLTVDIFCDNLRRLIRGEELTHVVNVLAGY